MIEQGRMLLRRTALAARLVSQQPTRVVNAEPASVQHLAKDATRLAPIAAAAYALLLVVFATFLGTWTDEEYTLATTAHGVVYAWNRAIHYELQAPLYFAVLAIWRHIDYSVWFSRLFSILCATGFLLALIPLLRRIAPERNPVWPALLIAFNPFVIYYALDIRLYATALLLSALGYNAFEEGFACGSNLRSRLAFVALSIIALYTQYLLGFAFVGYFAILLVRRRFRALAPYALALIAIALAALPLVGMIRSQVGESAPATASTAALLLQTLLHPWLEFILPYDRNLDALRLHLPHMALIVAIAALVAYARPRLTGTLGAAFACAAAIELSLVFALIALRLDLSTRHYVVLFVPALLAAYALFTELARRPSPAIARAIFCSYCVLSFSALYVQQYHVAQDGDTKRIGAFLESTAGPGAVIAIYPADALAAYARQYHGAARLVAFPKTLPPDRYDINSIDVHDESEVRTSLRNLLPARHVWLVMLGVCAKGWQQYGCQYVLSELKHDHQVVSEHDFYDSRVFALDLGRQTALVESNGMRSR